MTAISFLYWFQANQNATDADLRARFNALAGSERDRLRNAMQASGRK